mgnify:CR=1 FL=1
MNAADSPLAPKKFPKMPVIEGVAFATAEAGIRYKGRTDVLLATLLMLLKTLLLLNQLLLKTQKTRKKLLLRHQPRR